MIQGTIDSIFGVIWSTMLTLQIANSGNMSCLGRDRHSLSALVMLCFELMILLHIPGIFPL